MNDPYDTNDSAGQSSVSESGATSYLRLHNTIPPYHSATLPYGSYSPEPDVPTRQFIYMRYLHLQHDLPPPPDWTGAIPVISSEMRSPSYTKLSLGTHLMTASTDQLTGPSPPQLLWPAWNATATLDSASVMTEQRPSLSVPSVQSRQLFPSWSSQELSQQPPSLSSSVTNSLGTFSTSLTMHFIDALCSSLSRFSFVV